MVLAIGVHPAQLRALLERQDGVVTRVQLLELGLLPSDVRRMVRRRELAPSALPGAAPAAVHIAVALGRKVRVPAGVVVRGVTDFETRVQLDRCPPRMRLEHMTLDEMSQAIRADDVAAAFEVLSRVLGSRRTTVERILAAASARERISGRATTGMLNDARDGVCSVLERGYRDLVERVHGLPRPSRQHESTATGGTSRQDIRFVQYATIVELDGHSAGVRRAHPPETARVSFRVTR